MLTSRTVRILVICTFLAAALIMAGCQSRAASAEKLFAKGDYEKVVAKYPDTEAAQRARYKIADKLLQEKKYDVVLTQYADTRAAYQARLSMADDALKAGRYQMVIDSFPGTPAAKSAREILADSLFKAGQFDALLARFGETPQAQQVKEQRSIEELNQAKKLKGDAKKAALEEIMKKYPNTTGYKDASTMLSDIRAKEAAKKK